MSNKLVKLSKVPALKIAPDAEVAERLRVLVRDAEDGLRRVLKCGLYVEWISSVLPHGQLMPWAEAHCSDIPYRTLTSWRTTARAFCELIGLKLATLANLELPADRLLDLPPSDLSAKALVWRKKIEAKLEDVRSARQLFLDLRLKQGELSEDGETLRPKIGRVKGEGGASAAQRLSAKEARLKLAMESLEIWAQSTTKKLDEIADVKSLGMIGDETLARLIESMEHAASVGRKIIAARAGRTQPDL